MGVLHLNVVWLDSICITWDPWDSYCCCSAAFAPWLARCAKEVSFVILLLHPVSRQASLTVDPISSHRFAWAVGLLLSLSCFILVQFKDEIGEKAFKPSIATVAALICNIFTWLESAAGFCVGCFVYNNILVKYFGKEECSECKL